MGKNPNGRVVWRGPSEFDGQPIVVIVTGLSRKSKNSKTGNILQTWILLENQTPTSGRKDGSDVSICGDCELRRLVAADSDYGDKSSHTLCYVNVGQAPLQVYRSYKAGGYDDLNDCDDQADFAGKFLRIGSYGDPGCVPFAVWERLVNLCGNAKRTGYTHAWRWCDSRLSAFCMASCSNADDAEHANRMGWRTFRVRAGNEVGKVRANEINCPASAEMGKRLTCEECAACHGGDARRRSIAIDAHGGIAVSSNWNKFASKQYVSVIPSRPVMACAMVPASFEV